MKKEKTENEILLALVKAALTGITAWLHVSIGHYDKLSDYVKVCCLKVAPRENRHIAAKIYYIIKNNSADLIWDNTCTTLKYPPDDFAGKL